MSSEELQNIQDLANNLEDKCGDLSSTTIDDIIGALDEVCACATQLRVAVEEIELDNDDEICGMIPPADKMSVEEADSLKEVIAKWRKEHGYGES